MEKTRRILLVAATLVLLALSASAAKKVIFYEIGTPNQYKKDAGYSDFAERIGQMGYEISTISKGTLTRDSLAPYDILVIQLTKPLKIEEISSILWFVTTKGGGVLIIGETPTSANQLMIPFGMTMDEGTLIDSTDTIPDMDSNNFVVDRFSDSETTRIIRRGISKVGFYSGHGLFLSGNAECIASGDSDTYSDTQSFHTGSYPCVAATTLFGRGLVFGLSDADLLTNEKISAYNNREFGKNIIDWLSITVPAPSGNFTYEECQVMMGQLKLEKLRVEQEADNIIKERDSLKSERDSLKAELYTVSTELEDIKSGKIGPFTRNQWVILLFGLLFFAAVYVNSKGKRGGGKKKKGEEVLGELGYEFEDDKSKLMEEASAGEELETDELDKELGEL